MSLVVAGQRITAGILNRNYSLTDTTSRTVTAASLTTISGTFTIKANEPQANDMYELVAWGGGSQGSTQQNLTYKILAFGAGYSAGTMLGTVIPASQNFRWICRAIITFTTVGASASMLGLTDFRWSQASVNHSATLGAVGTDVGGPASGDTTADGTFALQVNWASTTGAPAISHNGSYMRRISA